MAFSVEIIGLRELQAKFDKLPAELKARVSGQIERGADVFVRNAKVDASKDFAGGIGLAGGISHTPVVNMSTEIVSSVFYSAYIEFGTITFAPFGVAQATEISGQPTLPAYAITFKGKGIRKTGGIYPHPFFFKQLPIAKLTIEKGIQAELNNL